MASTNQYSFSDNSDYLAQDQYNELTADSCTPLPDPCLEAPDPANVSTLGTRDDFSSVSSGGSTLAVGLVGDVEPQVPGRSRVIVKFKPGVTPSQIERIKSELGVMRSQTVRSTGAQIWDLPTIAAVDSAISANANGRNPVFEYIERDSVVRLSAPVFQKPDPVTRPGARPAAIPNDPGFPQLWGLNNTGQNGGTVDADIDALEAWSLETGNPNLVIGVIDTGVDYNHPDLVGNIWSNPGETIDGLDNDNNGYIDDIRGWDFAYGDNNPMDVQSHGTHVAGTIAGRGNNGVGVTGVTWNAKIMPLKFLNDSGSGFTSDAILAVDYATNKGVKITNNSWGGGGYSQGLYDAINAAGQAGSLFIAAAGNSSVNADISPMYPAAYDLANIISVASTTRTDALSGFSNYGLTSVDLGAPGSDIYSTTPNNSYATYSGTSMASPHVAGAAALLWSEYSGWTAQQVKNTLMQSGDSIAALAGRTVSGKRLNIYNALGSGTLPAVSVAVSPATVQEDGATNLVYTFTRSSLGLSSPLTVNFGASGTANATLVGSDPADYNVLTNSSVTFNPATRTGTVTFAAGATTAQVVVDPIADARPEVANETVALVVNSGTGYIGGTPGSATGTIVSEEALPIFTNPAPITIPSSGSGTPYPSTITVAGQSGNLSSLKVTLTGIDHTWPDDIDVLLVGPNGAKTILMSDVGSFNDISNVTLTFDDAASSSLPDAGQIVSGAYKPTDFESGDFFASPAPPGPYSTNFSGFYNASPNGTWSLYVTDDVGGDAGSLAGGWSIELQTGPALPLVTVAATDASAAETLTGTPPNPGRFTLTRTGATTSPLTVNVAMSGTATNGTDYTTIPATATFAAGSATAVVDLNVIDDALIEGTETATLTVLPGSGYTVGSIRNSSSSPAGTGGGPAGAGSTVTSSATVSIADNEPPLTVITLNAVDTGWYNSTGSHTSTNPNYFTGDLSGTLYRNWFAFNLPTLTQPIVSAQLRVNTYEYTSPAASETYELREVATAVPTLRAGGTGQTGIYADLGDGAIYGNQTFTNANDYQPVTINLNAAAISALTSKSGQAFALGGLLTSLDTIPNEEYVFGFSNAPVPGDVQLILNTGGSTLPAVTVAATDASAAETLTGTPPNPGRFTLTRTGATTSPLTVNVAMSGTATNGTDYTTIPATATFAAGSATAVVDLNVIDDALAEGPENAILTVTSGTGYTVGTTSAATVTIADNEPVVTIAATDASAAETLAGTPPNPGRFTLTRTGATTGSLTVNLQRLGTATNGTDYTTIPATATFAAGSATAVVNLNVIDDTLVEGPESAILTVATGTGYLVGADSAATVTIVDNDGATPAPVVTIAATDALAGETAVGVTPNPGRFTLTRTGATTGSLTVNLVRSGTATNGTDYTSIPLTATFAAGSSTALVDVSVIDDALIEGPETATLTVTTYGVGVYSVGAASTATVTILDNDGLSRASTLSVNNSALSLSNLGYGLTA